MGLDGCWPLFLVRESTCPVTNMGGLMAYIPHTKRKKRERWVTRVFGLRPLQRTLRYELFLFPFFVIRSTDGRDMPGKGRGLPLNPIRHHNANRK